MTIDTGDTAWMFISIALVMLMTPGVAFFYAGMVRRKNILSTIMMSFICLAVVGLLWVLYGYSLAFGPDIGGVIGGLDWVGLNGVGQEPSAYAPTIPHLAFMLFQAMFAIIAVALYTGAVVERVKFSALLVFAALWMTFVYAPVAHWVWADGGWLRKLGVLDFAGGIVIHINAGVSALALALLLGPRRGFKEGHPMDPNNIPLVLLGAGLLWFGWFGFNGGSALTSGGVAANAMVTTNTAAAAGAVTWMLLSWFNRRPSALGIATGAVVGLAAVTPAAGFITPMASIVIGGVGAAVSYYMMTFRMKKGIDESLDVWACHGMGSTWGVLALGLFATVTVNSAGANGVFFGDPSFFLKQLLATVVVWGFAFGMTMLIGKLIDKTMGLRVSDTEEQVGLDIAQHGERAYGGLLR